jgi:hypothetical protein
MQETGRCRRQRDTGDTEMQETGDAGERRCRSQRDIGGDREYWR